MSNVLVVGSGGREHAIAEKLAASHHVKHVFCCPGNAGTALMPKGKNVELKGFKDMAEFAERNNVAFTVVGPEQPLAEGIADVFAERNLPIFGFDKKTAQLEASKAFACEFMKRNSVACPEFWIFEKPDDAIAFLEEHKDEQFFIKADELCGGKGALPGLTHEQAKDAVEELMVRKRCGIGKRIVIEKYVEGEEVTIMAITDGKHIFITPASQDHKRLLDEDRGPNTGGMGAYAPAPVFDDEVQKRFVRQVLHPTLDGMKSEGMQHAGVLYFGLIIDDNKQPQVLEYNVRFGDPEAQPVLTLLESDFYELILACVHGKLADTKLAWSNDYAAGIVLATRNYPYNYKQDIEQIFGLDEAQRIEGVHVFHAGTKLVDGMLYTTGGRALTVVGRGPTLTEAIERAYLGVSKIRFEGMQYRKDIGQKAFKHLRG